MTDKLHQELASEDFRQGIAYAAHAMLHTVNAAHGEPGRIPAEAGLKPCCAVEVLAYGRATVGQPRRRQASAKYEAMNPENEWGSYATLVPKLQQLEADMRRPSQDDRQGLPLTATPLRPCGTCGQPYPNGLCPRHPPTSRQYRPRRKSVQAGTYSRDWQTNIRTAALERDAHECVYCGAHATTVDHIWPASRGGPSTLDNAAAACQPCNNSKKDSTVEEWIASGRAPAQAAARVLGNPRFTRTARSN